MSVAVIQGSSSGLGQALAGHLLRHTDLRVYALTRRNAQAVHDGIAGGARAGGRLTVLDGVDVGEEAGLERAARTIKEREGASVRLVACMAGILRPEKSLAAIDAAAALDAFRINALGHLLTYKHLVPLVPTRKALGRLAADWGERDPARGAVAPGTSVCWSMSARVGSIADNERGGWYSYRASKAALNQIVRTLDHELVNKSSSAVAVGYHPGTVLTPFTAPVIGSPTADKAKGIHTVDDAVGYMVGVMGRVSREGEWGGRCFDWKGERVEW